MTLVAIRTKAFALFGEEGGGALVFGFQGVHQDVVTVDFGGTEKQRGPVEFGFTELGGFSDHFGDGGFDGCGVGTIGLGSQANGQEAEREGDAGSDFNKGGA